MNRNPKCHQDDDCPISEGYMLVGGIGESIVAREAVLRLQTRLLEICQSDKPRTCLYPTLRLYGIGHTDQSGTRRNSSKEAA